MRHKSTVYSPEYHNQFQGSEEQIRAMTEKKSGVGTKDLKEGQSKFRIEKATKKPK